MSQDELPICLRIISIYYSPQLIKFGNKQRCKSSSVITLKQEFLFLNLAPVRDTQNKPPRDASLQSASNNIWAEKLGNVLVVMFFPL